jgi:glycosyltransferase involved in cell wall biosynthesis
MGRRVCMVVHHYFPRDVRVRREAKALAAAGFEVTVVSLRGQGEPKHEIWDGISIVRLPVKRHRGSSLPIYMAEYVLFATLAFSRIARMHLKKRFDVVHVHAPPDFLLFSGLATRLKGGARLILDIHDLSPELYGSRFGGKGRLLLKRIVGAAERKACATARTVITVTDVFKQALVGRGVPEEKIFVIHNYPDPELFPAGDKREKKSGGDFKLIHHGTLMRRYGADVLLDVFDEVVRRLPNATLDVYGEGDSLAEMTDRVAGATWGHRVTLHGDVPQDRLAEALREADACLIPNRQDPFTDLLLPTKLLEALHMGCPVITSATKFVAETFREGGVRLVPPADVAAFSDAIVDLAGNEQTRLDLAAVGREAVKKFSWMEEKKKLLQIYSF